MTDDWRTKNLTERLRRYSDLFGGDAVSIKLRPLRRDKKTGELEQAYIGGHHWHLHDVLRRYRGRDSSAHVRHPEIEIEDHETGPEIIGLVLGAVQAFAAVLQIIDFFSKRTAERSGDPQQPIEAISVEMRRIKDGAVDEKRVAVLKAGEPVTPASPAGKEIGKHLDIRA